MKLPNFPQAHVPERKITDYLLSPTHPHGRHKSRFFLRFGFTSAAWQVLADALRQHAVDHEVAQVEDTPFGTRYSIEGTMHAPDGRSPTIRVIWFIQHDDTVPRFVTAYPMKG
jgi:hypothetical protein